MLSIIATLTVGVVITIRRPGHRVGLLVSVIAWVLCLQSLLAAISSPHAPIDPASGVAISALWLDGKMFLFLWASVSALLFYFPTGELPGTGWRWCVRGAALGLALGIVMFAIAPGNLREAAPPSASNPLNPTAVSLEIWRLLGPLSVSAGALLVGGLLSSAISLLVRYRSSTVEQRAQTLAGVYLGIVAIAAATLAPGAAGSPLAVAAATLAAAAVFAPARRSIQRAVDRRFNRLRYDARQTVERFSLRMRDAVELESLENELLAVVGATVQPSGAVLWLRHSRARGQASQSEAYAVWSVLTRIPGAINSFGTEDVDAQGGGCDPATAGGGRQRAHPQARRRLPAR